MPRQNIAPSTMPATLIAFFFAFGLMFKNAGGRPETAHQYGIILGNDLAARHHPSAGGVEQRRPECLGEAHPPGLRRAPPPRRPLSAPGTGRPYPPKYCPGSRSLP